MRTMIARALVGLTAAVACYPVPADELRLRKLHEHRVVIENSCGRRVGSIRPLTGEERAIVDGDSVGAAWS